MWHCAAEFSTDFALHMTEKQLMKRFEACKKYSQAKSWHKPFLNFRRFCRNQLRKHSIGVAPPGELRTTMAFHLDHFTIVNGEGVGEQIASYGVFEGTLTEAFLRLVRPGQVVLDVGMHLGYYTTLFARLVGKAGEVHGFEPTPTTREIAAANVRLFSNVKVHPYAVWSSAKSLQLRDYGLKWMAFNSLTAGPPDANSPPPELIEVQTITLDDFRRKLGRPISLIKIDAESAEHEILLGMEGLLKTDLPTVSLEVGDAQGKYPSWKLVQWMRTAGYEPWELGAGKFVRHHARETYTYDNIIFVHPSNESILVARGTISE